MHKMELIFSGYIDKLWSYNTSLQLFFHRWKGPAPLWASFGVDMALFKCNLGVTNFILQLKKYIKSWAFYLIWSHLNTNKYM